MTSNPRTRRLGGRATALTTAGVLALGGLALASPAAFAADRDTSMTTAPEGVFVDIGYCMSVLDLCRQPDAGTLDPSTAEDWTSFVNTAHEPVGVGSTIQTVPAGATLVVRNDGTGDLTFDPATITQTVSNNPETTLTLNSSPGNGDPLPPVTLSPGQTWVYNIKGADYGGDQFDIGRLPSQIELDLGFDTNAGPVDINWSASPSSPWITSVLEPKIVAGDIVDGVASGMLSFDIDYRMSDQTFAWYKARQLESGQLQHLTDDSAFSLFVPSAEGLTLPTELQFAETLHKYITGSEASIPELRATYDYVNGDLAYNTNIGVRADEPVSFGEVVPAGLFHVENIPVTWTDGECLSFDIAGDVNSWYSAWAIYGKLNPATADLECVVPEDPKPGIDIRKNAEGDDKTTVERGEHPVTVTIINTGEDALTDFTFTDTTEAGNDVTWNQDNLTALAELTLEPGAEFVVHGTVLVEDGVHRDDVTVNATGVISGVPVDDEDPTELVPEEPPVTENPEPSIDIRKNDEGDDKHVVTAGEHEVVVTIINTGEDALTDFTFTDTTESGHDVTWNQDDLAALAELTIEPGDEFVVRGTVLVDEGTHRDEVVINATGVISGVPVDDEDPTELVPEEPPVTEEPEPGIDIRKNDEGDDKHTVVAGEHEITVTIVNTGDEALTDFTFQDTTESGNDVVWSEEDLKALAELTLQPGDEFVVHGTVLVEKSAHRDDVLIDATGVISGKPVTDHDPTELVPEVPPVIPEPTPEPTPEPPVTPEPTPEPTTPAAVIPEKPDHLATTGGEIAPWLIGSAFAAAAGGAVLLLAARRRSVNAQD